MKGRKDAHAYAAAAGLLPASVESGDDTQPVTGEVPTEQELGAKT